MPFLSAKDAEDVVLRGGNAVGLKNPTGEQPELPGHHENVEVQPLFITAEVGLGEVLLEIHVSKYMYLHIM